MIRNNKCSINDIPAEAKLCYVDVSMKGRLMMFFTIKPYSELRGDDWDDSPYEDNAGYPYYEKGERGKTFLVAAPNFSPEDSEDESAYQPMTEWELLNEYTRPGLRHTVYDHLSGACAWMYKYTARFGYDPDSVINAQTTFAQFLEKITPEDKAVLELYNWDEEMEWK